MKRMFLYNFVILQLGTSGGGGGGRQNANRGILEIRAKLNPVNWNVARFFRMPFSGWTFY